MKRSRYFIVLSVITIALIIVPKLSAGTAPDVKPFAASMLGHWPLDRANADTTGKQAVQLPDGASWCTGRYGTAIDLDGRKGYVKLGDLGSVAEATIAFWVKPRNVGKADFQGLVTTPSWRKNTLHLPIRKGRIDAFLHLGGSKRGQVQSAALTNGRWTHVGITISAVTGRMALYVDGVKVDEAKTQGLEKIKLSNLTAGYEGEKRYLDGSVDEIVILSRALSGQGVAYLAGKAKQVPSSDRLAGYPENKKKERLWQMRKGTALRGRLVRISGLKAIFKVGEKESTVALSDLTDADAKYARYLEGVGVPKKQDISREIRRTSPDFLLYDPADGASPPWDDPDFLWLNEHVLVQPNGRGELLAMWTSERLKPWKWSVKYSHSKDGGMTWTKAQMLDGPKAAWQVPIVSPKTGRIYVIYTHGFLNGGMRCRTSDDGGYTWSEPVELEFAKGPTDDPGKGKKASWISPTVPHFDSKGRPLVGFTRWATNPKYYCGVAGHCHVEFFRIENLADNPEPKDLNITWLNINDPITVPHAKKSGASYAQEPYTVRLPDGRLMVVMRTDSGCIWYSVSSDEGETWRKAEPLLDRDGGKRMKNPVSPCPIFALKRGDYVLLYNNNDGTGNGLEGPEDRAARRPAYLARGEFKPNAHQPIWFDEPKLFIDNDAVPLGPPGKERLEAATYPSLTEQSGRRILWYPDRKGVLLGKLIPDSLLDDDKVTARMADWREIHAGNSIPDEGYCDQPYVVVNKDGSWTCILTTGKGHEGQLGQHVVATISKDQGKTWSPLIDIEPADGPEASWAVPLIVPSGRIYAFYTYNGDRVRTLPGSSKRIRSDTHGWYCYKYSDDGGLTWSKRHRIPMRVTACDRSNQWKGKVQLFWGIDTPKISNSGVRFAFTKLERYFLVNGEGWMMHSDNILTETDPDKINWQLLPDGEHGLRVPKFGSVQEEHNHVTIGDDRLYLVYRNKTGYPCQTYSQDGGRTWTEPVHMTYSPAGGRKIKTPRACPKLWRCKNGKYLFWFHNHSGKTFYGRNPVWISGGIEKDGKMYWSEPEIVLYHNDLKGRGMSYPDLIQQDGRYWVTETQKTIARVHEIPADLLEGMWAQLEGKAVVADGTVVSLSADEINSGKKNVVPNLPNLRLGGGFSVGLWLKLSDLSAGQTILDTRDETGRGMVISTGVKGSVVFDMNDGRYSAKWSSDTGVLTADKMHYVVFNIDGGPGIISVVCDGVLCDGGPDRQFGWGRFDLRFTNPSGGSIRVAPKFKRSVKHVRIYNRCLRTSEAVANYKAGQEVLNKR